MGIRARGLKGMDSRMRGNDGVVVIPGVIGDPCGPPEFDTKSRFPRFLTPRT